MPTPDGQRGIAFLRTIVGPMTDYMQWATNDQSCPECGWTGNGNDADLGEHFDNGAEYACPDCGHYFGFFPFPKHEKKAQTSSHLDWSANVQYCPDCDWSGKGDDAQMRECLSEAADYECPKCGHYFGFFVFPTIDEVLNDPRSTKEDRLAAQYILAYREEFERLKFTRGSVLPEIRSDAFKLIWDFEDRGGPGFGRCDTLVRFGDVVLFREPVLYECYERFIEVAELLRERYGEALLDLVPEPRSTLYLYGDLPWQARTLAARKRIFGPQAGDDDPA